MIFINDIVSEFSPNEISSIPDGIGVYLFYGSEDELLYVGKSVNLRNRIKEHFRSKGLNQRKVDIREAIKKIKILPTATEIGALLFELFLIKTSFTIYNRRSRRIRRLYTIQVNKASQVGLKIMSAEDEEPEKLLSCYGLFKAKQHAIEKITLIAKENNLCQKRIGLAQQDSKACFWQQVGICNGVCTGAESVTNHDERLMSAIANLQNQHWPHPGKIILNNEVAGISETFIIDKWCLLQGEIASASGDRISFNDSDKFNFDRDIYRLLSNHLTKALP